MDGHNEPLRITLVSDAWLPQVNGVTTTLSRCVDEITRMGHDVGVISPDLFRTVPCPRYPHIRLAVCRPDTLRRRIDQQRPQAVHIATEGPLGLAARAYCRRRGMPFTTSFHTRFPEYLRLYIGLPVTAGYRLLRWFHGAASRTLVPTASVEEDLGERGFGGLVRWQRGADTELFRLDLQPVYQLPRPIFLYVGRVAAEKSIGDFLELELPGSKVVVGDGPALADLRQRFPKVHWAGFRHGQDLARHYADADVFVFPSRTDTYGVVMLEANAAGLPIAAYPVCGPRDVVINGTTGVLDDDLRSACLAALQLDRKACRSYALALSWRRCAKILFDNLEVVTTEQLPEPPRRKSHLRRA